MKKLTTVALIAIFLIALGYAPVSKGRDEGEARPEVTKQIKKYFRSNFGMKGYETTWYGNIRDVTVRGDLVMVHTDLSDNGSKARNICGAASGFVFSNENRSLGLSQVRVHGADGQALIHRKELSDPCS
jgi:hypothetical protein